MKVQGHTANIPQHGSTVLPIFFKTIISAEINVIHKTGPISSWLKQASPNILFYTFFEIISNLFFFADSQFAQEKKTDYSCFKELRMSSPRSAFVSSKEQIHSLSLNLQWAMLSEAFSPAADNEAIIHTQARSASARFQHVKVKANIMA